jgi:hypothetical protein|tara:strand:- start:252 stop:410 length:159 start_codon:yes stop_codon:yes gene_type:complete
LAENAEEPLIRGLIRKKALTSKSLSTFKRLVGGLFPYQATATIRLLILLRKF